MTARTTAATTTIQQPNKPREGRSEPENLSYRYGTIGIRSVAAAARFGDDTRKPLHAAGSAAIDQRFVESAG